MRRTSRALLRLLAISGLVACLVPPWVDTPALLAHGGEALGTLPPARTGGSSHPDRDVAPPLGRERKSDPTSGLETLEDERDRSLIESHEIGVWRGKKQSEATSTASIFAESVKSRLGRGWTIERRDDSRGALVLKGPSTPLAGGANAASVLVLLESLQEPFGPAVAASLEPTGPQSTSGPGSLRFVQVLDGARVAGASVVAHFDERAGLRSVDSAFNPGLRALNVRKLTAEEARRIAWADLRTAEPLIVSTGQARVDPWVWPMAGGFGHVWIVRHPTIHPRGSFVTRVDAATGRILSRENAVQSAIRNGTALVYRDNEDYPGNASVRRLRNLYGLARNPAGELQGTHFTILDDQERPAGSTSFRYIYHPITSPDSFDQVGAYYHLERAHARFAGELGVRDVTWFDRGRPVPVVVNVGNCDAFYSPDLKGDGVPGFVFGNQGTCDFPNEDFARDADVIYHEFAHGVLDWKGVDLIFAPIDSYQRVISEADADYHSANFTGDPLIGEVLGLTRNLENDTVYPDDVPCNTGYMEEHCTSLIWSGLLWDLRSVQKEGAEKLELASLDYLVDQWPDGYVATWLDFWDATMALMRADQDLHDGAHVGLIYGAAASRGLFGPAAYSDDHVTPLYQRLRSGTKFKSVGWVHKPDGRVRYYFEAPAGREISIKVRTTSSLQPDFLLGELGGDDTRFFATPAVSTSSEASLETVLPVTRTIYVLEVFGVGSSTGGFQISVAVR